MSAWRWAGLLACGGLGAVLAPAPEDPPAKAPPTARDAAWVSPSLPRRADQAGQALALASSSLFEPEARNAPVAAAAAAPEDPRWRIAGIVGRGAQGAVLVSFGAAGRAPQTLHVGDRLPSGHRIHRIEANAVCVQAGSKILRIGVQSSD